MAATLKKPSREKEEAGAGNMMLDVHPLHPSRPFPNRKPNRENRIKNACNSNSHSNIAPSNDKRPLFVQILAIPSASLVSTLLPVQCLRPSNFFFYRRIFLNSFLCDQILMTREVFYLSRDRILMTQEPFYLSRDQILIIRCVLYVMHEVTNLSDYASALSAHKEAPSGFAYFCPRNRKGVSVSLRK